MDPDSGLFNPEQIFTLIRIFFWERNSLSTRKCKIKQELNAKKKIAKKKKSLYFPYQYTD